MRILRSEDAAFQTGMDDHHLRLFAKLFKIDFLHQVEDGGVDVRLPAGIVTGGVGLSTVVGEVLADLLCQLVFGCIDEAAGS